MSLKDFSTRTLSDNMAWSGRSSAGTAWNRLESVKPAKHSEAPPAATVSGQPRAIDGRAAWIIS
jgi:hypothetical protein